MTRARFVVLVLLTAFTANCATNSPYLSRLEFQEEPSESQKTLCRKQLNKVEEQDLKEASRIKCDGSYLSLALPIRKVTQASELAPCVIADPTGGISDVGFCPQNNLTELRHLNFEWGYHQTKSLSFRGMSRIALRFGFWIGFQTLLRGKQSHRFGVFGKADGGNLRHERIENPFYL